MKGFVTILLALLVIAANWMFFVWLFKRKALPTQLSFLFGNREYVWLLIYALVMILAYMFKFYKVPVLGDFYEWGMLVVTLLCLTVIPIQIIRRNYSVSLKMLNILGSVVCALACAALLFDRSWQFAN